MSQPGTTIKPKEEIASPNATKHDKQRKDVHIHGILTTIFIALLIDILAFTIILPLLPRILEYYDRVDGTRPVRGIVLLPMGRLVVELTSEVSMQNINSTRTQCTIKLKELYGHSENLSVAPGQN